MFPYALISLLHAPVSEPKDCCGQNTALPPGGTGDRWEPCKTTPSPFYPAEQIKENIYENN